MNDVSRCFLRLCGLMLGASTSVALSIEVDHTKMSAAEVAKELADPLSGRARPATSVVITTIYIDHQVPGGQALHGTR